MPPSDPAAPSHPASPRPGVPRAQGRSRATTVVLLMITAGVAFVFVGALGLAAWLMARGSGGSVADHSFLELRLSGDIPDAPVVGGMFLDPQDAPPILTDIAAAIRRAKDDERIDGLYLTLDGPTMGWAGAAELRDAIKDFRSAGKPCVAYAETYTTGTYYLATACDKIAVAPAGVGLVTGLAASVTYYAGTFEKIGVQAQMLHVGDFKSAVEPYERTGPSEPASEAMNLLLDSLWAQFLAGVADGRGRSVEEVSAWIDVPTLAPSGMLERGMVDAVAFPDRVRALAHLARDEDWAAKVSDRPAEPTPEAADGEDAPAAEVAAADGADAPETDDAVDDRFTSLKSYLHNAPAASRFGDKIAVVYAEGPIVSGEADGGLFGGGQMIADRTFRKWIRDIREDDTIKAVVFRIDSPGGSALASDMMWRELRRLQEGGKPLVVSMGNYAASGGYYVSAPADWIVAEPATLTGSIGVFGGKFALGGTYEKLGMTEATYPRGAMSGILSTTTPFTDDERAVYQAFLDNGYETFLSRVSAGRELERDAVHAVAQGRVWTGEQAIERGLVDELGGLDTAIRKAAELASLQPDGYGLARWPAQKSFVDLLLEDLEGGSSASAGGLPASAIAGPGLPSLLGVPAAELDDLRMLDRVLADGGAAALLPGHLVISE